SPQGDVKWPAPVGEAASVVGQLNWLGLGRTKAGACFDRAVPMRRPGTVRRSAPPKPAQHLRLPFNAERRAQLREHALRIQQYVMGVDHRRRMAQPVRFAFEEIRLSLEPQILECGAFALPE